MRKNFYIALLLCTVLSAKAQVKKWTLQECVEYAFEHNISVRQSELDLQTTEVSKSDALGNFLPSANFSGGHSWNIGLTQNLSGILQQQTTQFTTAGFSTQVDIYKGLQNQMQMRRAKMAIIAGQYQLQKMKDDIGLNVANAFLDILFNKENLKVQQQQLQVDMEQAKRSNQLLESGQIPKGDLMDIEATVATDRQRVVQAENTLLISKLSLAQLLQLKDYINFDIADEDYNMEQSEVFLQTPEAIYNKAREQRTEIKLAQANLDVAKQDVKIARAAYQPSLTGFYSLNTRVTYADYATFDESGQLITKSPPPFWSQIWDNKGHSFGLQLSIPILNGLSTRNNVERKKIALEKSKLAFEQQELDLERTIYQAYTDAQGALKAYDSAVSAANARALSLSYATDRYGVGLINVFELNQAQTLSVNAQSEVLRSKYEFIFRVKILEFYFGLPIFQKQ